MRAERSKEGDDDADTDRRAARPNTPERGMECADEDRNEFLKRCNRFAEEAMELCLTGGTAHLLSSSEGKVLAMVVTRSRLARDLRKLGLEPGGVAMVYCRMSALGWVVGGAETVVRALLDALGPDGTLMAYTGWQDAPPDDLGDLDEETRRIYIEEHPAYDPRVALSRRDHGRVPGALRTWLGARHSGHPEAGVAVLGPLAEYLTASHPYDDAYGAGTPYARLIELGGQVVVLGAPLETVTLVHHGEAIARVPGKRRVSYGMRVNVSGERLWRTFSDIDTSEGAMPYERVLGKEDYIEHIARSALAAGVGRSGPVGDTTAHLFDARGLVEHAVGWIERNFASKNLDGA